MLINLNLDNALPSSSTVNNCNNLNRISSDQHFYTYLKQYSTKIRSSINNSFDLINELGDNNNNTMLLSNVKLNRESIQESINNINNKTIRSSKIKNVISNIMSKNKSEDNQQVNKKELSSSASIINNINNINNVIVSTYVC